MTYHIKESQEFQSVAISVKYGCKFRGSRRLNIVVEACHIGREDAPVEQRHHHTTHGGDEGTGGAVTGSGGAVTCAACFCNWCWC